MLIQHFCRCEPFVVAIKQRSPRTVHCQWRFEKAGDLISLGKEQQTKEKEKNKIKWLGFILYLAHIWNVTTAHQNAPDSSQRPAQIVVCISGFQQFRPPLRSPPKPRETLAPRTWTRRARRAAMAKNRNKKNKAKRSGSVAAMDTSEGGPATSAAGDAPQRNFPFEFLLFFGCFCVRLFRLLRWFGSRFFFFAWQQWIRPRENSHCRLPRRSVRSTSKLKYCSAAITIMIIYVCIEACSVNLYE